VHRAEVYRRIAQRLSQQRGEIAGERRP
jgi:hypothetical protein